MDQLQEQEQLTIFYAYLNHSTASNPKVRLTLDTIIQKVVVPYKRVPQFRQGENMTLIRRNCHINMSPVVPIVDNNMDSLRIWS